MSEMLVVCKAVRRGVQRALVSCDFPFGPLQEGADSAQALFDLALGIQHQADLFHVESVSTEYFAGMAYLYRVVAVE